MLSLAQLDYMSGDSLSLLNMKPSNKWKQKYYLTRPGPASYIPGAQNRLPTYIWKTHSADVAVTSDAENVSVRLLS